MGQIIVGMRNKIIKKIVSFQMSGWSDGSIEEHRARLDKTSKYLKIPADIYCQPIHAGGVIVSMFNLGKSTRLGLPVDNTELKTSGLYKISRNPMYLGFNMLTIAGMLFINHVAVYILGFCSMIVHHRIILGEE